MGAIEKQATANCDCKSERKDKGCMDGLIVGIDLCDEYTQVSCADEEKIWSLPSVICKNRTADSWYVGEDAYTHTLNGDGVILDKLVSRALKGESSTVGDVRYTGKEILGHFLEEILKMIRAETKKEMVDRIVVAVRRYDSKMLEILESCADRLGIPAERIDMISHAESFLYYMVSQKREIWMGTTGMFDLSDEGFRYYEMKVQKTTNQTIVMADYEELEESFRLDILATASGKRLADKIVCSCGERMMQKKAYSAIFLAGKGFLKRDWAPEFMNMVCMKRRVYMETALFARGASYCAKDMNQEKTLFPYTMICEGRLKTTISMNVIRKGQETSVVLASAGDRWHSRIASVDVIPDHQNTVDLVVTPQDVTNRKTVSIFLEGFPKREERTTKVRVQISFPDEQTMEVILKDQGLGELFPSSGVQIRQEVMI